MQRSFYIIINFKIRLTNTVLSYIIKLTFEHIFIRSVFYKEVTHMENHEHNNHCHSECTDSHCSCICGCGHSHEHDEKEIKTLYIRLGTGAFIFILSLLPFTPFKPIFTLVAYLILGHDVLLHSVKNILKGKIFDENFLMSLATIGAWLIGEYPEAAAVMLFYQIGELLQEKATAKSRKSITELMDIRPDYANLKKDNETITVNPTDVHIGDIIIVKTGEKVPLDGIVTEGSATLDTSALSGESLPVDVSINDRVLSGSVNKNGLLTIRVEKEFSESTVSKILNLVESSSKKKAQTENFITSFAKIYTPIVVMCALLVALVPPIFLGGWADWLYRALVFLVVSCPCALVLSVPLGFFSGIGLASKHGILIKGGNYIEALSKLDTVVFDKTGTLTEGRFEVSKIVTDMDKNEFMRICAHAEHFSNHPVAQSIKNSYNGEICSESISDYREISGQGIEIKLDGKSVFAGNSHLMKSTDLSVPIPDKNGSIIYVAYDNKYIGYAMISDVIKSDSKQAISSLKKSGYKTAMLTGDIKYSADSVGAEIGIDKIYSELLPQDKVEITEKLISALANGKTLAFVGDGINDAPVLARADIGIAMGGLGSDAAIEAADIVIMNDEPSKIPLAISISKKTMSIVRGNIIFSLSAKLLVMLLSLIGYPSMWLAIFADVGVALIAVFNSARIFFDKRGRTKK